MIHTETVQSIAIAAVQMDASFAPTAERLSRADKLVAGAAAAGAQLVVLPELFNTGYAYSDQNFQRAEKLDGRTVSWMRGAAAEHDVHLAGSLLLRDQNQIHNALLLLAPDGRLWRYDKRYPWGWERGYFRGGRGITVARTDLGDLGMLICWDSAHPRLWRRYAGRVDLMLICSCPPDISDPVYHLPNGDQVTMDKLGPITRKLKGSASLVFGQMINQQAAWLGVPAVNTVGCGRVQTTIPNGRSSLLCFLPAAPWLLKYLPQAPRLQLISQMVQGTKIVDAGGRTVAELTQAEGESFVLGSVSLPAEKRFPRTLQPKAPVSPLAYLLSDGALPLISLSTYRRGLHHLGLIPPKADTVRWQTIAVMSATAGLLLGYILGRRKR